MIENNTLKEKLESLRNEAQDVENLR